MASPYETIGNLITGSSSASTSAQDNPLAKWGIDSSALKAFEDNMQPSSGTGDNPLAQFGIDSNTLATFEQNAPLDSVPTNIDTSMSIGEIVSNMSGEPGAQLGATVRYKKPDDTYNVDIQATKPGHIFKTEQKVSQAQDIVSKVENVYGQYSTILKSLGGFISDDLANQAKAETDIVKQQITDELYAKGFDNIRFDGSTPIVNIDGKDIEIDSGFVKSIWAARHEIFGSLAGMAGGARQGALFGAAIPGTPHQKAMATLLGATVGGALGSVAGATGGKGLDILVNKLDFVNEVDSKLIGNQMYQAGVADIFGNVFGSAVVTGIAKTARGMKQVFNFVVNKNPEGALRAALDHFGGTKEQAMELVTELENLVGPLTNAEGGALTDTEKILKTLALTRAGGEAVVDTSNVFDPKASARVAQAVFQRAQDLLDKTKSLSADVLPLIKTELNAYINEVKAFYKSVKDAGGELTPGFVFDFEKVANRPLLETIGEKIENPALKLRYNELLSKIDDISKSRDFNSLIELKELIDGLKFSNKGMSYSDKQAINKVLDTINAEIQTATKDMPGGDKWLESWKQANIEYSKMKQLEKNVLYKALTKPGKSEEDIVKALTKYIAAGDNTFYEVMDKLPKQVRNRIDGAVLNEITEKFTAGVFGGNRAVNFPLLSKELAKINWSSPKVKQTIRVIHRMANVFKNDVNLARVSGKITIPEFQSYLTADPVVRLKYEVASSIFNYIKMLIPGAKADTLALARLTGDLLENPLNGHTIDSLKRGMPMDRRNIRGRLDFTDIKQQLQQAFVERQKAMEAIYGTKDIPPRLVWKGPRAPEYTIMDSVDDVLYATERGTVANTPTEAIMYDRGSDLLAEWLFNSAQRANVSARQIEKAAEYLNTPKFNTILKEARNRMKADMATENAAMLANIIKREASILQRNIERDLRIKMPKSEAEKLIQYRFKEMMKECK